MFADVSFPISIFRTFTYSVPVKLKNSIKPGLCIKAQIGNKICIGFVIKINKELNYSGKIKDIQSIPKPTIQISKELMKTIIWTSQYYLCPLGKVLKTAIPIAFNNKYTIKINKVIIITNCGKMELKDWSRKTAKKQLLILQMLNKNKGGVLLNDVHKNIGYSYSSIKSLKQKNLISIFEKQVIPNKFIYTPLKYKPKVLSKKQCSVYNNISSTIGSNQYSPFLIHGVTGSGKTEIYIKLSEKAIKLGKKVLVLVPEINLTPQLLEKFKNYFGNKIALWHSKIKTAEKGWVWQQLHNDKFDIVIGARSAIFLPIDKLGLIIVDEEHENSYKQNNSQPRYNARDIALVRSKISKTTIVLGSATPSLETYYNCLKDKIKRIELDERYGDSINPKIEVVNMLTFNNDILFSQLLIDKIVKCLDRGEQIILFHNRRGYSLFQKCNHCDLVTTCVQCSINLTYHKSINKLICHHCQYSFKTDNICLKCGNKKFILFGTGTQKIEESISELFPKAKLLRMDSDAINSEEDHFESIKKYEDHRADILIGTQMVAKGLDFHNVTLVGVINADLSLSSPDFRSGEKIFQLLYQVCGRAGRHKKKGCAVIQTHNPRNIYIKMASELDIAKFYNIELANRLELSYPPIVKIVKILITGKLIINVIKESERLKNKLKKNKLTVLGPIPAPIEKIKSHWRYIIIIKSDNKISIQSKIIKSLNINILEKIKNKVKIQLDVDPISLL